MPLNNITGVPCPRALPPQLLPCLELAILLLGPHALVLCATCLSWSPRIWLSSENVEELAYHSDQDAFLPHLSSTDTLNMSSVGVEGQSFG